MSMRHLVCRAVTRSRPPAPTCPALHSRVHWADACERSNTAFPHNEPEFAFHMCRHSTTFKARMADTAAAVTTTAVLCVGIKAPQLAAALARAGLAVDATATSRLSPPQAVRIARAVHGTPRSSPTPIALSPVGVATADGLRRGPVAIAVVSAAPLLDALLATRAAARALAGTAATIVVACDGASNEELVALARALIAGARCDADVNCAHTGDDDGSVDVDALFEWLFPPGAAHPHAAGRLILWALHGPLGPSGALEGGPRGARRPLRAAELAAMIRVVEDEDAAAVHALLGRGGARVTAAPTRGDARGGRVLPWERAFGPPPVDHAAALASALRTAPGGSAGGLAAELPRITRGAVDALLADLPRDGRGRVRFADAQARVLAARCERVGRLGAAPPALPGGPAADANLPRPIAAVTRAAAAAWAHGDTRKRGTPPRADSFRPPSPVLGRGAVARRLARVDIPVNFA